MAASVPIPGATSARNNRSDVLATLPLVVLLRGPRADWASQAFAEQFPHGRFIAHPEEHWKPPYSHVTRSIQTIDEFFGPVPVANEALLPINAATLTPRERKCSAC